MVSNRILTIFTFLLISFILLGCSSTKDIYIYEKPKKGTYIKAEYTSAEKLFRFKPQKEIYKYKYAFKEVPIDPYDTATVREKSIIDTFTVMDIKKEKGIYVITVTSNTSWIFYDSLTHNYHNYNPSYLIVSPKNSNIKGYKQIEKGQCYKLILNPCFEPKPIIPIVYGDGMVYEISIFVKGMWIPIRKSALNICTSPNLEGLYYR